MKKTKKMVMLALATTMALSATGCNVAGGGGSSTVTSIKMIAFQTGYGTDWINDAIAEFEERNKETVFETGKKGVDIRVEFTKSTNYDTMSTSGNHIYFTDGGIIRDLADRGLISNLNDIATEKYDTRNGKPISIKDKIAEEYLPMLTNAKGDIYGLSGNSGSGGLTYDAEMFARENFYIADPVANGTNTSEDVEAYSAFGTTVNFVAHKNAKKSCGADGVYGTDDDGLPTALTELLVLCDKIKENAEITPFTMTGEYPAYGMLLSGGISGSLNRLEESEAYYTYEGKIRVVDGYTNEPLFTGIDYIKKPKIKEVELTETTGDLLTKTVARYYGNAILDIAYTEGWMSKDSTKSTVSHTDAQGNYLCSGYEGKEECAMLIEGNYWWTEAEQNGKLKLYESVTGKTEKDVRWMPLPVTIDQPVFTEGEGVERVIGEGGKEKVVINKNTEKKPGVLKACKEFIKMIYSDEWLSYYSGSTGNMKPAMNYEVKEEDMDKLSSFHRSYLNFVNASNSKRLYQSSTKQTFFNVSNDLRIFDYFPSIKKGNQVIYYSDTAFGALKDGHHTQAIFEASIWSNAKWLTYVAK